MAKKVGSVYAEIRAKVDKLEKDMAKANGVAVSGTRKIQKAYDRLSFDKATASFKRFLGAAIGAYGISQITSALSDTVKAAAEWERRVFRTEQLISATGNAAGFTGKQLSEFANQMDLATLGSREGFLDAINAMQTFRSVHGEVFKDAIRLTADLSEVFGIELRGQAVQLGKALEDPVAGLTALRRVGVSFTDQQKDMVKALVETGRHLDAQKFILGEVRKQVGGAAEKAAGGLSGSLDTLSIRWRDLKEAALETSEWGVGVQRIINSLADAFKNLSDNIEKTNYKGMTPREAALKELKNAQDELRRRIDVINSSPGVAGLGELTQQLQLVEDKIKIITGDVAKAAEKTAATVVSKPTIIGPKIKTPEDVEKETAEALKKHKEMIEEYASRAQTIASEMPDVYGVEQLRAKSYRDSIENAQAYNEVLEEERRRVVEIDEAWGGYINTTEEVERQKEILKDASNIMSQNFSDAFASFVMGAKSAKEAFQDMAQSIISAMVRMASQRMFEQIFGAIMNFAPTATPGNFAPMSQGTALSLVRHGGGSYSSGGAVRSVPASAFSFAPRLHNGLMPDEFPAVLQKGESVIPKGGGGGVVNNYYQISAMDVRSFAEYLRRSGAVPAIVSEDMRGNGMTRRTMKSKW